MKVLDRNRKTFHKYYIDNYFYNFISLLLSRTYFEFNEVIFVIIYVELKIIPCLPCNRYLKIQRERIKFKQKRK